MPTVYPQALYPQALPGQTDQRSVVRGLHPAAYHRALYPQALPGRTGPRSVVRDDGNNLLNFMNCGATKICADNANVER